MEYDDGAAPPPEIIQRWLEAVRSTFQNAPDSSGPNGSEGPAIAVHCVAGLGRAPVLVAIALIEYGQVRWLTAVPANQRERAVKRTRRRFSPTFPPKFGQKNVGRSFCP